MLLIITDEDDYSTHEVIDWLQHYGVEYFRLNESDKIKVKRLHFSDEEMELSLEVTRPNGDVHFIDLCQVSAYWYRRGYFNHDVKMLKTEDRYMDHGVNQFLNREIKTIDEFLHLRLKKEGSIGSIFQNQTNKLHNLITAKKCGIQIPDSLISGSLKNWKPSTKTSS